MFKDYKSNYCPQARMSNYVKLWLKTAQLPLSSLGGSRRSRAHVARPGQGSARAGTSPWHHGGDAALAETWDRRRGMSVGPQGSREKGGGGKGERENQESNGSKGPQVPSGYPSLWAQASLTPAGKSSLLLWGTGTLTPPGPLPALFFSVFLWEPFTSSKREVCVYFSSLPFDSNSPLFFCQRVRNKFRFKRQPEMCMHAQNCFIFIMP